MVKSGIILILCEHNRSSGQGPYQPKVKGQGDFQDTVKRSRRLSGHGQEVKVEICRSKTLTPVANELTE